MSPEATLSYTGATRGLAPIPACEQGLPTATAEAFFKVSDASIALEGPAFDRQGNLLFVDIYGGRVLRLSPDRVLTTLYQDAALQPAGIAVHRDGRIFVAAVGNFTAGRIIALRGRRRRAANHRAGLGRVCAERPRLRQRRRILFHRFQGHVDQPDRRCPLRVSRLRDDHRGPAEHVGGEWHRAQPRRQGVVGHRILRRAPAPGRPQGCGHAGALRHRDSATTSWAAGPIRCVPTRTATSTSP